MVIIFLLINNYLLIKNGLWDKREQDIENIYYANDRIAKTKDLKFESNQDIKKLNNFYLMNKLVRETLFRKTRITERVSKKKNKNNIRINKKDS